MNNLDEFRALGLSEQTLTLIAEKGFETPSPIQSLTIPMLMTSTSDIIAQAQTGTGKTAAFGLPLIEKLSPSADGVKAIILVPTRELALQVTEELLSFNRFRKLSIAAIYGGASIIEQLRRLKKGIDIVVGTPGRTLDHIHRGTLDLSGVEYLVLDEADEMLNMGFIEDIEEIMAAMGDSKRVMLFSATMPARIVQLSKKYMNDTKVLKVDTAQVTTDLTDQIYFEVKESDKFDALTRIIDVQPEFYGIVFSRTKVGVDEITNRLLERGYAAEGLHGDVSQAQREKILRKFKKKQTNILVATDVAARGIDINNLTHVINYSLPQDTESYVHRIGRTGRAGNQGTAITFISNSELRRFGFMKRDIKADIKKESLPSAQDIVAMKRNKIKDDLQQIVESENYADCKAMAEELLDSYSPHVALSALLRLAFKNELSESNYSEIRSFTVDRRGKTRLFISIGRLDGYDARKMVALLKRECGMNDNKIDDVKVMDSYSFVTVPFADAENVVRRLNALRKGERPIAEVAKDSREAGSNEEPRRSERSPRRERPAPKPRAAVKKDKPEFHDTEVSDTVWDEISEAPPVPKKQKKDAAPAGGKKQDDAPANDGDWFAVFEKRFGNEGGSGKSSKAAKSSGDKMQAPSAGSRVKKSAAPRPSTGKTSKNVSGKKESRRSLREKKGRK